MARPTRKPAAAPRRPADSRPEPKPTPAAPFRILPEIGLPAQALLLVLLGFLLYANTIPNRYAVDDLIAITENEYTKKGLGGIGAHLTSDSFEGYFGKKKELLTGGRYRPLSLVSFAVEWGLWGENPHLSHALNALLYGLLCWLLLVFLRNGPLRGSPEAAFLAALLFALHPIHTEAVANVKGRDELLSLLCLLPALGHFVRHAESRVPRNLLWGCVLLFLSLLAKENALMTVALLPLTLWTATRLSGSQVARATLPALGVIAGYLLMRVALTGPPVGQGSTDVMNNPYIYATAGQAFATKVVVLGQYLVWLFWPWPLSWDYSYPQVPYHDFSSPFFWLSLAAYGGLLYALWAGLKRRSAWGWAAGWFLFSLFIVSNLMLNIGAFMGERFLFQPSVGWAVAAGLGLAWAAERVPKARWGFAGLLAAAAGLAGFAVLARNQDWKSNETLYIHDVNVSPRSAKANLGAGEAHMHLAAFDSTSGLTAEQKAEHFRLALKHFDQALSLYPQYNDAFLRKGLTYLLMEKNDSASAMLAEARKLYPDNGKLLKYQEVLGNRYFNAAIEARKAFLSAVERRELETARLLARRAIDLARRTVEADPRNHGAWSELGGLYGEVAMYDSSYYAFGQATQLLPEHEPYWFGLGISHLRGADPQGAVAPLERALRLNPNNPQTRAALDDARRRAQPVLKP